MRRRNGVEKIMKGRARDRTRTSKKRKIEII